MRDLSRRLSGDRGQQRLQSLAQRVPGFAGYASKEFRRDADRLLRSHLADRLLEQRRKLEDLQAALVNANRLSELPAIEAPVVRLNSLADELRTASYGYAGWFDAATIDEAELDAIYRHDFSLSRGVDWVADLVASLSSAFAASDADAVQRISADLNATIDRLAAQVVRRREIVLEAKKTPVVPPRQFLTTSQRPARPDSRLPELRLGDAVSYQGTDYVVTGRVKYTRADTMWWAFLLQNGEERWLWSLDDGKRVFLATPVPVPEDLGSGSSVDWQGEELNLVESDYATADVEGETGRQRGLSVEYQRFESPTGRVLWLERWGDEESSYLGDPAAVDEIEVWQRPQ